MTSRYRRMVVEAHEIPFQYNLAASAASWTILAGFFIFPGTFTSLASSKVLQNSDEGRMVQDAIQNASLLPLATCSYLLGVAGVGFLWWKSEQTIYGL